MAVSTRPRSVDVPVADLLLDPLNPRLPEDLQGTNQGRLLRYLFDHGALDELARSFVDNGYFDHEPLIITPSDGQHIVLEGNRRLATLLVLLRTPEAEEEGLEFDDLTPTSVQLRRLRQVPCFTVADREQVHKFLGFRHIGGIKTWSAEAKARYLYTETERAVNVGSEHPFLHVARRVGSNVQGVRNSYLAIHILRHARDERNLNVEPVLRRRFGVWLRCMNAQDLRSYIGLDSPRSYEDIRDQVEDVDMDRLAEVLRDLSPRNGGKPILADSRDVTIYARVLQSPSAHQALRRYDDLQIARQVVELADLPVRLDDLRERVELALEEVHRAEATPELTEASEALFAVVRSLRSIVRARAQDEDEDD